MRASSGICLRNSLLTNEVFGDRINDNLCAVLGVKLLAKSRDIDFNSNFLNKELLSNFLIGFS